MTDKLFIPLPDRALLAITGAEARPFLQGLISNDVGKVAPGRAIHAALLTPQGKYLHDFFVFERDGALRLDAEAGRADDLLRRLKMYRLRVKVEVARSADRLAVFALIGAPPPMEPPAGGTVYADPRLPELGARAVAPPEAAPAFAAAGYAEGTPADYDRLRLALGVPDGSRDLVAEKSLLLENGFDELNGVDFDKGCYVGQEITARMKHRALIKKRLFPVAIDGAAPPPGAPIRFGEVDSGEMRSSLDGQGLAVLRLDHVEASLRDGVPFAAGAARLTPRKPSWLAI
jgi:folate-binding protein YgfZ